MAVIVNASTLQRMQSLGVRREDLVESFSRASGPGGQHVNKVSTAATIRHEPTGIMITASDSRSQSMNRQLALLRLLDELERRKLEKRQSRLAEAAKTRRQKARRSRSTKRKIMDNKRHRGETKQLRGKVSH
ncbi:MAG: peptide chain release factor-like protein [Chthoniobacterales bacterium]